MAQLRRFLYLDEPALNDYLSALEDGLRERRSTSAETTKTSGGGVNARVASASLARESSGAETTEISDNAPARFARLVDLAAANEEAAGWVEIQSLEQLEGVGRGALVHLECEAYIPDVIRALGGGEMTAALDLMQRLAPMAGTFGFDMEGLPSADESKGIREITAAINADLVFVGESDASDWKIAGKLGKDHIRDPELDDYVRVVGKVSGMWEAEVWKPLLALPGASLLSRAERRKLERERPEQDDGTALQGPAVMLDVLAIYR